MQRYPVVVVGGGPAGATAARALANRGITVLLLERARLPRVKPCGGALTHRALPLLPEGYEAHLTAHPTQWSFQGRSKDMVTVTRSEPYCHIVERQYFDQFLVDAAQRTGATVHDGESLLSAEPQDDGVLLTTDHGQYHAQFVIAADGAHGIMAKSIGFQRPVMGAAMEAEVPVEGPLAARYQDRVEIHVGQYPWGYAWVIPRGPILNIGVGSFRARSFPVKQRFFDFARQIVGERPVKPLAHPLPYRLRYQAPLKGRTLFVGDAAGYMDAFSAEGIYSALRSGQLAAEAVFHTVAQGAPLDFYNRAFYQEFWPSLKSAVKMGLLFYPLSGFWSEVFVKNRSLLSDYLDVAMGQMPYHELVRHTERQLLRHPSTLVMHRQPMP